MRLDKMLAHLGYGSRKEVKEYIRKGYVMVNGDTITNDDFKVDEENDEIIFLDQELHYEKMLYFLLITRMLQAYIYSHHLMLYLLQNIYGKHF